LPADWHSVQAVDRQVSRTEGFVLLADLYIPLAANILDEHSAPITRWSNTCFGLVFMSGNHPTKQMGEVSKENKMEKYKQAEGVTQEFRYVDC